MFFSHSISELDFNDNLLILTIRIYIFILGFLAQYIQGKPLDVCIRCGIYAATEVIKQSGCAFPEKPQFKE